jgi:hypothetical protein
MDNPFDRSEGAASSRTEEDVNAAHIVRTSFPHSIGAYAAALISFTLCVWAGLAVSLPGGLFALWVLDVIGLSHVADSQLSGALCLLGLPLVLLATGLYVAAAAGRQHPVRLMLLAGALGIIVGSIMALAFVLTGGWSGLFA